ncbi:hypothetical protein [uncultured Aquitalea sp.]|uniref:hypothetical protein n=1 Tax=uncultured Aquitalea sp. TaxID=540272 RepID=UPI0025E94729|nr:hypothetical protein [uncultured Aquitalea sp.]
MSTPLNTGMPGCPTSFEHAKLVSVFASKPLSEIPLIDLRNALRIYKVSFADGMSKVDDEMPALALLALREMRRRLSYS